MKEMNYTKEQLYEYGIRDIPGYEGLYGITSCGRVWSYKRKIFLKPCKTKDGYLQVTLYKNGKSKRPYVHRLVLETYCPIENANILDVDHIDFNRQNNCLNNLRWLPNMKNRGRQQNCKRVLCIETGVIYESTREAARQTGIAQSSISQCCNGKLKTAAGFHWQYID